ncbi:MAG TPA: exosome complex RNA-binding protein Rrp4 [Candidatus Nanoarchaeia archaeon]|nr:exosome complex RNA-binding protein Rrp4 [Candidatus Nanoarchaeia archaeon]
MGLLVKQKDIVVPGEVLADSIDYLPGMHTYRLNNNIIAKRVGLVEIEGRALKLIPVSGRYLPKVGDKIIAKVVDITMSGWMLNINSAYNAMLNSKDIMRFVRKGEDLTRYHDVGDYLKVKIFNVTSQNLVDVTMKEPGLSPLHGGRIVMINPQKVPRVIGKMGSMVMMIKDKTKCLVNVGQNGVVWIKGPAPEAEFVAIKAIKKIEDEAHLEGLTDRMTQFLDVECAHLQGLKSETQEEEPRETFQSFQRSQEREE